MTDKDKTVVIGAGMAGLAAGISLLGAGFDVTLIEKEARVGGKMREVFPQNAATGMAPGQGVDAGPTVFTMKWAFDEVMEGIGKSLDDYVGLSQAKVLARHGWRDGSGFDLHSTKEESAAAIEAFSDADNANGYLRFAKDSERIFNTLQRTYIAAQRPSAFDLTRRVGNFGDLLALRPFSTLWSALDGYFSDLRLKQLFGRYATYCGSSPYLSPATLMLIAHVEQDGVWLVDGGMHALAQGLATAFQDAGGTLISGNGVSEILMDGEGVTGVRLENGDEISATSVVHTGDASALAFGMLGQLDTGFSPVTPKQRSLSAMTWCLEGKVRGFELSHHNVFFSDDYADEFSRIFNQGKMPAQPTVYICAQDRGDERKGHIDQKPERLFMLINAPANGDMHDYSMEESDQCLDMTMEQLAKCGLEINPSGKPQPTTPSTFNSLFPGSGGAIYGRASHGWMASFKRQGAKCKIPGLYLAGGSVHPGPGVPMAAISGRLAAESLAEDRVSMPRFRPTAIFGGMSTA